MPSFMNHIFWGGPWWSIPVLALVTCRPGGAQSIAAQRWQLERALVWNSAASDFGRPRFANVTLVIPSTI